MQTSSLYTLSLIPGGSEPPVGTGPLGLGEGKRWKTVDDVVAFNSLYSSRPPSAFTPEQSLKLSHIPDAMQLRDYQKEAVDSVQRKTGNAGVLEIGCGLGKTFVGAELIRRKGQKAVVVCQHNVGVNQFVDHLKQAGFKNVATSHTEFRLGMPIPDVTVLTYHTIVRTASLLIKHVDALNLNTTTDTERIGMMQDRNLLLYLIHVVPIGTLCLDEVHVAVADNFRFACCIRHNLVVGMSGSLIREDLRLKRLQQYVGTTTFRYFVKRRIDYFTIRVPLDIDTMALLGDGDRRSKINQAILACHPNKLIALKHVLRLPKFDGRKFIVFCDSPSACNEIFKWMKGCILGHKNLVITGRDSNEKRDEILERFSVDDEVRIILSTRVCDAGVDLPDGTVVVQLYQSCGSRQQEIQRAGRGTRHTDTNCTMIHIVNAGTEEEVFMQRRLNFMTEQSENTIFFSDMSDQVEETVEASRDQTLFRPVKAVASLKIHMHQNRSTRMVGNKLRKRVYGGS